MADTAQDLRPVVLDCLARTAAVAALATGQVDRQPVGGEGQPGGDSFDRDAEGRTVLLAGCQESEPAHLGLRDGAGRLAFRRFDAPGTSRRQRRLHHL